MLRWVFCYTTLNIHDKLLLSLLKFIHPIYKRDKYETVTFLLVIQFQARCHPKYTNIVGCRQNCAGLWTKQKLLEDVTWKQRLVVFIIISVILFTNILLVSSVSFKMHHSSRRLQSRKYSVYSAISLHARLAFLSCLSCAVGDVIAAQSVLSSIRRLYADYTWLFDRVPTWLLRQSVSECVEDVARWFLENGLLLNPAKTEADGSSPIWHHGLAWKDSSSKWHWCGRDGSSVPRHCQAARWYTRLSPDVRPARHSSSIIHVHCGTSDIRPLLTFDAAKTTAHSIVSSRLDYANALLHGTSASNFDRLQVAQNSLARTVCQAPRSASYQVTSATSLVANSPTRHLQDSSHYLQDTIHRHLNEKATASARVAMVIVC